MKVYVYFNTNNWDIIHKIQQRFGLSTCVTVNGETCEPSEIKDEDVELLRETERLGFIKIRRKEQ